MVQGNDAHVDETVKAWVSMMQGDFGLSLTQDGYLPAAFLVRCLTPCPILPLPLPGRHMMLPEFQGLPCTLQTQTAAYAPCSACAGMAAITALRLQEDVSALCQSHA